jgi:hypothetical protein
MLLSGVNGSLACLPFIPVIDCMQTLSVTTKVIPRIETTNAPNS